MKAESQNIFSLKNVLIVIALIFSIRQSKYFYVEAYTKLLHPKTELSVWTDLKQVHQGKYLLPRE